MTVFASALTKYMDGSDMPWKFLAQDSGCAAFDVLYRFVYAELRVYFHKQMYVVGHDFHFNHVDIDQDLAAIFWAPYHMILAGIDHMMIAFIFYINIIQQVLASCNTIFYRRGVRLISPRLKAEALQRIWKYYVQEIFGAERTAGKSGLKRGEGGA